MLYHDDGNLTKLVLEEVAHTQGPAALKGVLRKVGERLAQAYRDEIWSSELEERVNAWAELLDRRGIAVEIEQAEGAYVVREYGCPYQNVALENRAVCEMERQVMAALLEAGVTLTECRLDGHRGCQFTIAAET
jgi:predicted ArsR family transcriptional regulator